MDKIQKVSEILFYFLSWFLLIWLSFFAVPVYENSWKLIVGALLVNLIASFAKRKSEIKNIFTEKENIFLLLYFGVSAIGVLWAENKIVALDVYLKLFLPGPILYFLFKNELVLVKNKNSLNMIISIFGSLVALFAVLETIFHSNILYKGFIYNPFYATFSLHQRAMATQFIPQVLGTYLVSCICCAFYFVFFDKNMLKKVIGFAAALLMSLSIFLTGTRGAFAALIFSIAAYLRLKNRRLLFIFCILIFAIILVFNSVEYPLGRLGLRSLLEADHYRNRIQQYNIAMRMVRDYPFKGVGLGHYQKSFNRYFNKRYKTEYISEGDKTPDNMFLMMLCETGLFCLLFFAIFIFSLLKRVYKYIKSREKNYAAVFSLFNGVLTILISMLFYDSLYWVVPLYIFWIYCGMLAAIIEDTKDGQKLSA